MAASVFPTPRDIGWYGLKPDSLDQRDRVFAVKPSAVAAVPDVVDLRAHCCRVMNQGDIGSCGPHSVIAALRFLLIKMGLGDRDLARLQTYFDARAIEGATGYDSGSALRDVIKCVAKLGVAREPLWPYDIAKFKRKPTRKVYADALKFTALEYKRVEVSTQAVKVALAAGFPVVIGVMIYKPFEGDEVTKTGVVPMPAKTEAPLTGHAMLAVGYGVKPGHFLVQNSWDTDWGEAGFCHIPEDYIGSPDQGSDYWTITSVKVS